MFTDIVFPKNNEDKFLEFAEILGYDSIIFVYDKKTIKKQPNKQGSKIKIFSALLTNKPKPRDRKEFDLIITDSKPNPKTIKNFDIIFNLENQEKEDFIHHRNSGLNQILCKLATEKETAMAISFSNLLNKKEFYLGKTLGRINQNLTLCRKYKTKTIIASFAETPEEMRKASDLRALVNCIFSDESIAKNTILNLNIVLEENIKKKDKNYISKDIKIIE